MIKWYSRALAAHRPWCGTALWAFFVGGAICLLGEGLRQLFLTLVRQNDGRHADKHCAHISCRRCSPCRGWYQKLAAKAGAGTLVPITGFANSVVSPAIEFKAEGWVTGVGAKIFGIAGPVIAFGTLAQLCVGCGRTGWWERWG